MMLESKSLLYLQTIPKKGELAHLVERLHGMQEVTGSIPVFSTAKPAHRVGFYYRKGN